MQELLVVDIPIFIFKTQWDQRDPNLKEDKMLNYGRTICFGQTN